MGDNSAVVYQVLQAGQEEDYIEARVSVTAEPLGVDVLLDDISRMVNMEFAVAEALERRKRHGVIGYT